MSPRPGMFYIFGEDIKHPWTGGHRRFSPHPYSIAPQPNNPQIWEKLTTNFKAERVTTRVGAIPLRNTADLGFAEDCLDYTAFASLPEVGQGGAWQMDVAEDPRREDSYFSALSCADPDKVNDKSQRHFAFCGPTGPG